MEMDQVSPLSITQERSDKKSITDLSIRSSQCSLLSPNSDEFYEICKSQLKVSPRNAILQQRIKYYLHSGHSEMISISFSNSDQFEELAKKTLEERRKLKEKEVQEYPQREDNSKVDCLSPMIFFIVPENHLKYMIPDFEAYTCQEYFLSRPCHESSFGLARLSAFNGKFNNALEHINKAMITHPDAFYELWQAILKIKAGKVVEKEPPASFFQRILCCGPSMRRVRTVTQLEKHADKVEGLWGLYEISSKAIIETECPEVYASKIKDLDKYFGYLAWGELSLKKSDLETFTCVTNELIRTYNQRPEAYVKLWNYAYYTVKDYDLAEGLMAEALLTINPNQYMQYYVLFCIYTAKCYYRQKKLKECFGFLQRKFIEHPTYPVFLFEFGRLSTKSEDFRYNGAALGALNECLSLCDNERKGLIYYWIAKAYMLARLHIDAYENAKRALEYLPAKANKKKIELRQFLAEINPNIVKIQLVETYFAGDLRKDNFDKCKKLCCELQNFHKLTSDILYSKTLWKVGRHEEALKKLYSLCGVSTVKMSGYFQLLEFLKLQDNVKCMKTVATEMITKCRNPQVPCFIWKKVNLIYAKILVKMRKPGKAILLLKSLAKFMPPFPFAEIQYTKALQRAKTIQDLSEASSKVIESYNAYSYSTYKSSFVESISNLRDFSKKLIEEEEHQPEGGFKAFGKRRLNRLATEKIDVMGFYQKKESIDLDIEEKSKHLQIPDVKFSENSDIIFFSVCSDPIFLYKIGKIAMKYNICLQDGLCSVSDYLELLKLDKDPEHRESCKNKATKLYTYLLEFSKHT